MTFGKGISTPRSDCTNGSPCLKSLGASADSWKYSAGGNIPPVPRSLIICDNCQGRVSNIFSQIIADNKEGYKN